MARGLRRYKLLRGLRMEPGPTPINSAIVGYQSDTPYIHSSYRGFQLDVKAADNNIVAQFDTIMQRQINAQIAENKRNIEILHQAAQAVKPTLFNIPADADIQTSPVLKPIYDSGKVADTMRSLSNLLTFRNLNGELAKSQSLLNNIRESIRRYNRGQDQLDAARKKFYSEYAIQLGKTLTDFYNLLVAGNSVSQEQLAALQTMINSIPTNASSYQDIRTWEKPLNTVFNNRYWASELGLLYEQVLAENLQGNLDVAALGKENRLADLVTKKSVPMTFDIPNSDFKKVTTELAAGFSVKLRSKNDISVSFQGGSDDLFASFFNDDANKLFNYYFVNFTALSIFNSSALTEDDTFFSNSQSAVLGRLNKFVNRYLAKVRQFAILRMLNLAFFGNIVDAGQKYNVFNPQFMPSLLQRIKQGSARLPLFLLTGERPYETWQVFKYFNDLFTNFRTTNQISSSPLMGASNSLWVASQAPSAAELRDFYYKKVNALTRADLVHNTIYDRILNDSAVLNFLKNYSRSSSAPIQRLISTSKRSFNFRLSLKAINI